MVAMGRRFGGSQSQFGHGDKEKNVAPLRSQTSVV
jgi:hypothetical protein